MHFTVILGQKTANLSHATHRFRLPGVWDGPVLQGRGAGVLEAARVITDWFGAETD